MCQNCYETSLNIWVVCGKILSLVGIFLMIDSQFELWLRKLKMCPKLSPKTKRQMESKVKWFFHFSKRQKNSEKNWGPKKIVGISTKSISIFGFCVTKSPIICYFPIEKKIGFDIFSALLILIRNLSILIKMKFKSVEIHHKKH